ncbi:hypothetical protein DB345_05725 [Spartobacteria bacterium LR76]|nr:hypothetical protein DB345_05725 [Spartobacteria bacterium LR76]
MKRPLWKKLLIGAVLAVILCAGIVCLVALWLIFDGWSDWRRTQEDLRKRGELLTVGQLVPPPIPDGGNFFADSFWEPNAEGKVALPEMTIAKAEVEQLRQRFPAFANFVKEGNRQKTLSPLTGAGALTPEQAEFVLAVLEPTAGSLQAVERLAIRPLARYPLDYSKGLHMEIPHLTAVLQLSQMLAARAQASAAMGQTSESVRDVLLILRLGRAMETDGVIISELTAAACYDVALKVIEKLLPGWSDAQAAQVDAALAEIDLLPGVMTALRMERATMNATFDRLQGASVSGTKSMYYAAVGSKEEPRHLSARSSFFLLAYRYGFLSSDRAFYNRCGQRSLDLLAGSSETWNPKAFAEVEKSIKAETSGFDRYRRIFSWLSVPTIVSGFPRFAFVQSRISQARVACAIQRYALRHGALPDRLADLVPEEMAGEPRDLILGGPLHYRREGKEYLLWSIGWNAVDDGGEASSSERKSTAKLDWVWKGRLPVRE